jgi:molecular chaperone GrpE
VSQEKTADGPESSERGGHASAEAGAPEFDPAVAFKRRAQLAEDRLEEVLSAYRTLKRENDGHRERVTRNIERRYESRHERLLLRFIEILDNLDRALEAAETAFASQALVEGLILVRTQLLNTLKDEGLERIPALGFPYDPNHSEAVGTAPVSDPEQHHVVVKELLRGYKLGQRVARAARVVVGEYAPTEPDVETVAEEAPPAVPPVVEPDPEPEAAPEAAAAPPGASPALDERPTAEMSLDDIIAQAEALDRGVPAGSDEADAVVVDDDDDDDDDVGADLLGYLGDDAVSPKKEDDRG